MNTILITGANRGIGLELARQYLACGWRVHAACRQPDQADTLQRMATDANGQLNVQTLDVADMTQIQALAQHLRNEKLDILLNNAGVYGPDRGRFGETDCDAWLRVFLINSIAPMKMMEAFVDHVAAGSGKIMANMTSKMGSMGDNTSGGYYVYRASKAALNAIVKSASLDLRARGVCVLALHPGWVKTDMGGPNAEIDVTQCVTQLRATLDRATLSDSGAFFEINGGIIPW